MRKKNKESSPSQIKIEIPAPLCIIFPALEAIFNLVEKYEKAGKKLTLKHLSSDCKQLLYKSSPKFHQVIEESIDDPRYHLAANPEQFEKSLNEYKF